VWPLLKHSRDPRVRSYLIHRFGPLGADAEAIVEQLKIETDVEILRALILSLGPEEYAKEALPAEGKKALVEEAQKWYRNAADPGLHAAAEWLLRQWGEEALLVDANAAWAKDKEGRENRLESIRQELLQEKEKAKPKWYVTGQGQTMVVIPAPG